MGNEFGHPEWIDFPRPGNNLSYAHARRQWSLVDNPDLKFTDLCVFDKAMIELFGYKSADFFSVYPCLTHENDADKILAFSRAGYMFVFNFNPEKSFTDYKIQMEQGKYKINLSTDSLEFGGAGRIDTKMTYYTTPPSPGKYMSSHNLSIYLPSRCGLVFKKEQSKGIYNLLDR